MSAKASPRATSPLDTITMHPPAYTEWEFQIIWDRDRQPFGLVIDDRYYRVRPSPRLRRYPGNHHQTIFERVAFGSNSGRGDQDTAEDGPDAA